MKTIVITGNTQGIGLGLTREFLKTGCQVMVSSRRAEKVNQVVQSLQDEFSDAQVAGTRCDVSSLSDVQALWNAAVASFGKVDIWINNAGRSHDTLMAWKIDAETIESVVSTNILGLMLGSKVAIEGMLAQGHGFVYNMEGLGSDGRLVAGTSIYSSSKLALRGYTKALVLELKDQPVKVGYLSPGMVVTDLLSSGKDMSSPEYAEERKIFNILADRVETVTPFLANEMLKNEKHGKRIAWLTSGKVAWRFMSSLWNKRDVFTE